MEKVDLIEQESGPSLGGRDLFRFDRDPLPIPGKRGFRRIGGRIDGLLAELIGDLQKQRGLAHLAGPGQKLNAPRGRLAKPAGQKLQALKVTLPELAAGHTRIIIRLRPQSKGAGFRPFHPVAKPHPPSPSLRLCILVVHPKKRAPRRRPLLQI
jgi:hypothetical protein